MMRKIRSFYLGYWKSVGEISVEAPYRKTSYFEAAIKAKSGYVRRVQRL